MKARLKDVAKAAGVAPATVSNFLNESAPVSEDAKKRITEAIKQLNYVPPSKNQQKKSMEIALFLPNMVDSPKQIHLDETFSKLFNGIIQEVVETNYRLDLIWQKHLTDLVRPYPAERKISGVLYPHPHQDDKLPQLMQDSGLPFVILGELNNLTNYHSVDLDNLIGIQNATQHLIDLGHRKIAFIAPCPLDVTVSYYRYSGYQMALTMNGIPVNQSYVSIGDDSPESAYRIAKELLQSDDPPTAIVTGRDILALGVLFAAKELGIQVPHQLAVTGFDDTQIAAYHQITSVKAPLLEVGREATKLLIRILKDGDIPPTKIVVPTQLVVRSSSDPAVQGRAPIVP